MAIPTGKLVVNAPDPRINYNLLPGEKLLTCPYNLAHAILPLKFNTHVLKCHQHHLKEQQKKGEKPLFSICKYDRSHHVRNAEIAYHESICETRKRTENEDGWGWEVEDNQGSASGASAALPFKIPVPEPPKIDAASMANVLEEDWESEPPCPFKFDPDKRVKELRKQGYTIIKSHKLVGLSKSEKQEFLKKDQDELEGIKRINLRERQNELNSDGNESGAMASGPSPSTSTYAAAAATSLEPRAMPMPALPASFAFTAAALDSLGSLAGRYGYEGSSDILSSVRDEDEYN